MCRLALIEVVKYKGQYCFWVRCMVLDKPCLYLGEQYKCPIRSRYSDEELYEVVKRYALKIIDVKLRRKKIITHQTLPTILSTINLNPPTTPSKHKEQV